MIYLDHAATSFPKPKGVLQAMERWYSELGVSAVRGDSRITALVAAEVEAVRGRLAGMCAVPTERLVFTSGATESLNLFLRGFLRAGDRVLTTALEHSSVVRPLMALKRELGLELEVLAPDPEGFLVPEAVEKSLVEGRPRLLAFTQASNVTGTIQEAALLCDLARARGCTSLLDASQSAGLLDLSVGADALVASAHKSLLGPPGLGILAVRPEVELRVQKQGGTGSSLALAEQPRTWPQAMESGTPNTPAILGLAAALDYLEGEEVEEGGEGREATLQRERQLLDRLKESLRGSPGLKIHGPQGSSERQIPVLSFTLAGLDPAEAGICLDQAGISVRTGYHCTPWIHRHLGTEEGGTIRASIGPFIVADDVLQVTRALCRL